jgi:uncharacterized protein involved in exopolysaccharide biosynthesis
MNPLTARWIFCVGLFVLAACAVLPEPAQQAAPAPAAEITMTTETKLARVVRERAELSARYGDSHPAMIEAAAAESTLREAAAAEDRTRFRRALIRALSEELSDALQDRRELSAQYGEAHPRMRTVQGVIFALTNAINAEVHTAG